ncbi:MAG: hypothetical protein ACXVB5_14470, partial [Isosphaeraceae bacterium]
YGFYLRHVKGLTFEDVTVDVAAPDLRPAVVGEDVEDLELSGFRAAGGGAQALMCLRDARQVYVHGCRPLNDVPVFLSVEGAGSREILLQANDLRRVGQTWALADGARPEAIHEG